jgi:hypothetical protein
MGLLEECQGSSLVLGSILSALLPSGPSAGLPPLHPAATQAVVSADVVLGNRVAKLKSIVELW